ncbi:glycosyltransferase family protein [Tichowtungia aerotolerans]|uniref:Glycosyltransferase n=1 Tax=Tichowtungia aerotolerans TaxID=2697043 RepID=A0A6P1M8J1_9BACT|nr:hypothetical protein [Tichowtungia aerotolerans]QHI70201.1 hypothetical protein GT409_12375 [Tichowtungia aerotolerans]
MKLFVVTPSRNQLGWLKCCVASVRDQVMLHSPPAKEAPESGSRSLIAGQESSIHVHHHVQDACSTDGTVDWLGAQTDSPLPENYSFSFSSELDSGMYDALNKGFDRSADADILSWLNCDEQYLEGALTAVEDVFTESSALDLLAGSLLLTRPDGTLLARRQAIPFRENWVKAAHLYNLSGGLFFRRSVWERGIRFDTAYRNLGDEDWVLRLLSDGLQTSCIKQPLAAFSFTGNNLSRQAGAQVETDRLRGLHPVPARTRLFLNLCRRFEKIRQGAYRRPSLDYAVYTTENPDSRTAFHIEHAPFQWPKK